MLTDFFFFFFFKQWVPESAPGEVVKIESPNQFAPVGADPKELKQKFQKVCNVVLFCDQWFLSLVTHMSMT